MHIIPGVLLYFTTRQVRDSGGTQNTHSTQQSWPNSCGGHVHKNSFVNIGGDGGNAAVRSCLRPAALAATVAAATTADEPGGGVGELQLYLSSFVPV